MVRVAAFLWVCFIHMVVVVVSRGTDSCMFLGLLYPHGGSPCCNGAGSSVLHLITTFVICLVCQKL